MRLLSFISTVFLLQFAGFLTQKASGVIYLEVIDVPATAPTQAKKSGWGWGKRNASPQVATTLSERYALTPEGKRKARARSKNVNPNETHRIMVYKCSEVLRQAGPHNTEVVIDIGGQTAYLLVSGAIGLETEISTARSGKVTPRGVYKMTERVRNGKISNLYDVEMPYWMRLGETAYGVHSGYLPGYPASAGCIRLPEVAAEIIYRYTERGSLVRISGSWRPSPQTPVLPVRQANPPKARPYNPDILRPSIPKYPKFGIGTGLTRILRF